MSQNGTANGGVRRSDFASGAAVRLDLPGSDRWVLVRAELSYGQQRRLALAGVTGTPAALADRTGEARLTVDWAVMEIERLVTWVMDWSFRDGDGDRVAVSRESIEALHPDTAQEITAALDAYLEAQEAKKAPAPAAAPNSAATSPSAKPSAGAGSS